MNPSLFLVFIFAALTIFALVKIVSPFLEDREAQLRVELLDEELQEIEELVARKSVLLQGLRDIEFDYETGKLSEADYERLRKKNERQAVQVMRKLDDLRGDVEWDDEIDSALEERLRQRAQSSPTDTTAEAPAETPPAEQSAETIACPECDKRLEAEARFCSRCGHKLADETTDDSGDEPASTDETVSADLDSDDEVDPGDDELSETAGDRNDRSVSDLRSEATG